MSIEKLNKVLYELRNKIFEIEEQDEEKAANFLIDIFHAFAEWHRNLEAELSAR